MNPYVTLAVQVLPASETIHPYDIVDKAIEVIQKSGFKYTVCPFETVMEGDIYELLKVVTQIQEVCYQNGTKSMMTYIKIQTHRDHEVTIDDKMSKYK